VGISAYNYLKLKILSRGTASARREGGANPELYIKFIFLHIYLNFKIHKIERRLSHE